MIEARFSRNAYGRLCGFDIHNHGDPAVCAAVSALAINCVNSVERFTEQPVSYDYDESGRLVLELPHVRSGADDHDCELLLNALLLGLQTIREEYPKEINVIDR